MRFGLIERIRAVQSVNPDVSCDPDGLPPAHVGKSYDSCVESCVHCGRMNGVSVTFALSNRIVFRSKAARERSQSSGGPGSCESERAGQGQPPIFRDLASATSRPWQIRIRRALSDVPSTECPLYACHTISMNVSRWSPPHTWFAGPSTPVNSVDEISPGGGNEEFKGPTHFPASQFPFPSLPPQPQHSKRHVGERTNRVWSAPRCSCDASATLTTDNRPSDLKTISRPCTNPTARRKMVRTPLPPPFLPLSHSSLPSLPRLDHAVCGACWTRQSPRCD